MSEAGAVRGGGTAAVSEVDVDVVDVVGDDDKELVRARARASAELWAAGEDDALSALSGITVSTLASSRSKNSFLSQQLVLSPDC